MQITTLPQTVNSDEAIKIARGGGNIFGKMMFGSQDIHLKLMYLESKEVIFDLNYKPAPLMRIFGKTAAQDTIKQKIRMLVEGTRCTTCYLPDELETVEIDVDDVKSVQATEYSQENIISAAKRLAIRMIRRQIGKIPVAEVSSVRSIYRPFYIAFYGQMNMGEKVRYLPIAADGNSIQRSL